MAGSVNKVILIGRLGQDPEIRNFNNGGRVVNLRLATSETWKDRNTGERKERTEWHTIRIDNESHQRFAEQFLKKGAQIYVEGTLRTEKWTDDKGNDRYTTKVVLGPFNSTLTAVSGRGGDAGGSDGGDPYGTGGYDDGYAGSGSSGGTGGAGSSAAGGNSGGVGFDDEIPF